MRSLELNGGAMFGETHDAMLAPSNRFEGGNLCSAFDESEFDLNASGSKRGSIFSTYKQPASDGDTLATIAGSGYFNAQADNIQTGDFILVFSARATGGGAALMQMVNTAGVITEGLTAALS